METTYPLVASVKPLAGKHLLVEFRNGTAKVYDCTPLLAEEAFAPLADETLFRSVRADPHGYGVLWNDAVDLAESELWLHGETAGHPARAPHAPTAR
ncbi:MAG: DUF2442 domain-containing protein [Planctomycetes bacterium]|nr:DUF2442 domain-containing protein [Planctomycetota bacterium]